MSITAITLSVLGTGVASSVVTALVTHKDRMAENYSQLTETLGHLQNEIDQQSERINQIEEDNSTLRQQVRDYEQKDDWKTAYLRQLFHWLNMLCEVLDSDWLKDHPKPHLPEEIRPDIEGIGEDVE